MIADTFKQRATRPCATAPQQRLQRVTAPRRVLLTAALAAALWITGGCAQGTWRVEGDVRDDVVSIQQYPAAVPWLRDDEGRINGLTVRAYFVSAQTERGVFVPGTIEVELDVLTPSPDGGFARQAVHVWRFNEQEAAGYRMRTRSSMGYSYGFVLRWPPGLNLAGREIQLVYKYTRANGTAVTRRSSHFQVPAPAGQARSDRSSGWRSGEAAPARPPATQPNPNKK